MLHTVFNFENLLFRYFFGRIQSMSLSVGIVGLPNVGKSTLFHALTQKQVDIANYPFCTIDPNVGVVKVPDERLQKLAEFSHSQKVISAIVEFVDIAGLVKGANKGEGLGNQFLSHIREVDAIAQVVRCFENTDITHVEETVNPLRDMDTIHTELILKDLETVEKRISNLEKEVRGNKKGAKEEQEALQRLQAFLNEGKNARVFAQENQETEEFIKPLFLLSFKPVIYLFNADSEVQAAPAIAKSGEIGASYVIMNIKDEDEMAALSPSEIQELGLPSSKLPALIGKAYNALNLITFFTTGEDETRAWTIAEGSTAPAAGAAIHSDFQTKFIRASVIHTDKLLECASYAEAVSKGFVRTEGKEYLVQDGDVIEFKHS